MDIAGVLPEDAPDPRLSTIEQLRQMPVPILGLTPQPSVEDWGAPSAEVEVADGILDRIAAAVSYTLWRNPTFRDDPMNLAELDDATRSALDTEPPWPRPNWLIEMVQRGRYPMLWEAVRTTWYRDADSASVPDELVEHANHVLRNHFITRSSNEAASTGDGLEDPVEVREVEHGVAVSVNGAMISGIRISTNPYVLALGADLGGGGILTAVIDRNALPYLDLEFITRQTDD